MEKTFLCFSWLRHFSYDIGRKTVHKTVARDEHWTGTKRKRDKQYTLYNDNKQYGDKIKPYFYGFLFFKFFGRWLWFYIKQKCYKVTKHIYRICTGGTSLDVYSWTDWLQDIWRYSLISGWIQVYPGILKGVWKNFKFSIFLITFSFFNIFF